MSSEDSATSGVSSMLNGMSGDGDLSFPMAVVPLDGLNYLEWSRGIKLYITARGKIGYINGRIKEPHSGSAEYDRWNQENSMVMSWLLVSMQPQIRKNFMWAETANEIWEQAKSTYSEL